MSLTAAASAIWRRWPGFGAPRSASRRAAEGGGRGRLRQVRLLPTASTTRLRQHDRSRRETGRDFPDSRRAGLFRDLGSEATETMVKLAWVYHAANGKPASKIIARERFTLDHRGGVDVRPAAMHREFGLPLPGFAHALPRCLPGALPGERGGLRRAPRRRSRGDDPTRGRTRSPDSSPSRSMPAAASCAAEGYFAAIEAVRAARHPGARRRGGLRLRPHRQWFGCQTVGMTPDMMALAKGITSSFRCRRCARPADPGGARRDQQRR